VDEVGLVLSCLIRATGWANAPRWGGRLRCWLAAPLPLPQQWTCSAVQIVTHAVSNWGDFPPPRRLATAGRLQFPLLGYNLTTQLGELKKFVPHKKAILVIVYA
jgi:hypothetical protein